MTLRQMIGYDPQLLLTDQRTPTKEWVDRFRELVAEEAEVSLKGFRNMMLGKPFPPSGAVTGRFKQETIPYLYPGSEVVMRKPSADRKSFEAVDFGLTEPFAEVDYGLTEARVLAATVMPKTILMRVDTSRVTEGLERVKEATSKFAERMAEFNAEINRRQDRMVFLALYGDSSIYQTDYKVREKRIAKLVRSSDRRQRKRGERLLRMWNRYRFTQGNYRK